MLRQARITAREKYLQQLIYAVLDKTLDSMSFDLMIQFGAIPLAPLFARFMATCSPMPLQDAHMNGSRDNLQDHSTVSNGEYLKSLWYSNSHLSTISGALTLWVLSQSLSDRGYPLQSPRA